MNLQNLMDKNKKTSPMEYVIMGLIVGGIIFIVAFNFYSQRSVKKQIDAAENFIENREFEKALEIYEVLDDKKFGTSKSDSLIYLRMNELPDSIESAQKVETDS